MSDVQKIGFYSLQTLLCLKNWRHWGDYLRSLKKTVVQGQILVVLRMLLFVHLSCCHY